MSTRSITNLYNRLYENEIRYLALLPGEFEDSIECRLIQGRDLPADIAYEALSYEWGPPRPEDWITVNGVITSIRENLRNALRRLRRKERGRLLWVDAICINQDDIPERNAQGFDYEYIFGKVDEVLVWLGEEGGDSRWLFETISEYKKYFWKRFEKSRLNTLEDMRQILNHFFNRSYWRRVWIIQEVFSASRLSIWCGSAVLPMACISASDFPRGRATVEITTFEGHGKRMTAEYNLRSATSKDYWGVSDLARLLSLCSDCYSQCSDIRDRIYGLISLSKDIRPDNITVDYSKHPARLYFDVMQASIFPVVSTATPSYLQLKTAGPGTRNISYQVQKLLGDPL